MGEEEEEEKEEEEEEMLSAVQWVLSKVISPLWRTVEEESDPFTAPGTMSTPESVYT